MPAGAASGVAGLGLGTTLHALPFQASINVSVTVLDGCHDPTAVQAVAEEHETLVKSGQDIKVGVGSTTHLVPSQCSTSGRWLSKGPTAMHSLGDAHEIDRSPPPTVRFTLA